MRKAKMAMREGSRQDMCILVVVTRERENDAKLSASI